MLTLERINSEVMAWMHILINFNNAISTAKIFNPEKAGKNTKATSTSLLKSLRKHM